MKFPKLLPQQSSVISMITCSQVKFFAAGGQVWSEVDGHEWPASSSQKLNVIEILGVRPFGGSGEITINGRASNSSVIASPEGRLSIRVNLQMNQANVVDYSKA